VLSQAGVEARQLRAMEAAARSHWQQTGGQAPTVSAPEGFLFATPAPPPPCRSGTKPHLLRNFALNWIVFSKTGSGQA
jgi:hypothetical protein